MVAVTAVSGSQDCIPVAGNLESYKSCEGFLAASQIVCELGLTRSSGNL